MFVINQLAQDYLKHPNAEYARASYKALIYQIFVCIKIKALFI